MILTIPRIELQTTVDKYSGSKMEIYIHLLNCLVYCFFIEFMALSLCMAYKVVDIYSCLFGQFRYLSQTTFVNE
jgi:hypothetical protein